MDLRFHTKRDDFAMIIDENQNVGIGTTSPTRLLEVESAADAYIRLQSTASLSGSAIFEMVSGGTGNSFIKSTNNALYLCAEESGVGVIIFRTGGTNEQMRILANGNVGIGTASPSATLHVIGNAGATTTIEGSTQSTLNLKTTSPSKNNYIVGTTAGDLSFRPNGVTSTTLKANGNLLIGTTTDSGEKLQVNGSAKFTGNLTLSGQTAPQLFLTSNTAGTPNYTLIANASSQFIIGRAGVANDFIIEAGNTTLGGSLTGTTATFSGNLNIINGSGLVTFASSSSGNLTIDAADDIRLDAGGGDVVLRNNGTEFGRISTFSNSLRLTSSVTNENIILQPNGTGQVIVPTTPTLTNSAASKSYVDAQVGASDTLAEVLAIGNTSGANDIIMANNQSYKGTHLNGSSIYGLLTLTSGNVIKMGGYEYTSAAVEIGCGDHAKFLIGSTEKMRLSSGGNLLLGNTSGTEKLSVSGNIAVPNGSSIMLGGAVGDTKIGKLYNVSGVLSLDGDGTRSIRFGSTTNGEVMRVDNTNQRIGIGTTSPSAKIVIQDTNALEQRIVHSSNGTTVIRRDGAVSYLISESGIVANRVLAFGTQTQAGSSITETMRIVNSNILIGTTTDSGEKLQVNGSVLVDNGDIGIDINKRLILRHDDVNASYLTYTNVGSQRTILHGFYGIEFSTQNGPALNITQSRNVIIGNTSDNGAKLQVTGSTRFTNTNSFPLQLNRGLAIDVHGTVGVSLGLGSYSTGTTYVDAARITANLESATSGDLFFQVNNGGTYSNALKINNDTNAIFSGSLTGTTATFSGLVSGITPVGVSNFATKGYVDSQVGASDTLQEVTDNGNTTTNSVRIGSSTAPNRTLSVYASSSSIVGDIRSASGNNSFLSFSNNASTSDQVRIGSSSGNAIIATNYTERVRITSGGNLLLGTTSEHSGSILNVTGGNVRFASQTNNEDRFLFETGIASAHPELKIYDKNEAQVISINANPVTPSYFNSGSNFGIGTSIPGAKLEVNSGGGIHLSDDTAGRTLIIKPSLTGLTHIFTSDNTAAGYSFENNAGELFRIGANGNVLIGSTSDNGYKLQINGGNSNQLKITSGNVAWDASIDLDTGDTNGQWRIKAEGSDETFQISNIDQGGTSAFSIHPTTKTTTLGGSLTGTTATFTGNLGLGTITPQQKIHIVSTDGSNIILNSNTGAENNGIFMTEGAAASPYTNGAYAHYDSVANAFKINTGTSTLTTKFTILKDSGNILINSTSDNGQKLQVTGNVRITGSFQVANTGGFLLADTGGSMRYGLKYGAAGAVGSSNLLMLTNRSLSSATGGGEVAISANSSTSGVTETEVMRIKANTQSQVSIDGVLSLTSQNTPADPPNRASTIWLDSNYDLKIKITNNSGVTVTKTLAEYA